MYEIKIYVVNLYNECIYCIVNFEIKNKAKKSYSEFQKAQINQT